MMIKKNCIYFRDLTKQKDYLFSINRLKNIEIKKEKLKLIMISIKNEKSKTQKSIIRLFFFGLVSLEI